jgi:hypothetical protein
MALRWMHWHLLSSKGLLTASSQLDIQMLYPSPA